MCDGGAKTPLFNLLLRALKAVFPSAALQGSP
jgi:hypothetical protein